MCTEAAGDFAAMLFLQRMRTPADGEFIKQVFRDVWSTSLPDSSQQAVTVTPERLSIGRASLTRSSRGADSLTHVRIHVCDAGSNPETAPAYSRGQEASLAHSLSFQAPKQGSQ